MMMMTAAPPKNSTAACEDHDFHTIQPIVIASAKFQVKESVDDVFFSDVLSDNIFDGLSYYLFVDYF